MKTLINLFFLLRKGVYPYEDMDSWERFDEASMPDKEALYSSLNNMEDIADVVYGHVKRAVKNLYYQDLYVQSDTLLLLADTFENVRNKCIEMCELDPAHFLSAPGLA